MKTCTSCGRRRQPKAFRDGHKECRECEQEKVQAWRKQNPEKYEQHLARLRAQRRASKRLIERHPEEFNRLVKAEMKR